MLRPGTDLEVDAELVAVPDGTSLWLTVDGGPLYAVLHGPGGGERRPAAALIVGPFGWEDASCYRPRRAWARALADAGFVALRIDLPGTGDSPGPSGDPEPVGRWTPSIAAAARWLREIAGADRVAAIGIGLGGLLCVQALADGAGFDDLVLWGAGARGRAMVRELRAYAGMVATGIGDPAPPGSPTDGMIDLAGFRLSEEAARMLEQIDLTAGTLGAGGSRPNRALLIGRGGAVDQRLRDHLEQAGVATAVEMGEDYGELMAPPQQAAVPQATITRSIEWLAGAAAPARAAGPLRAGAAASSSVTLTVAGGAAVRETLVGYDAPGGRVAAIVSEPAGSAGEPAGSAGELASRLCVVLPNAGAIRRAGPNRMWTELARRAAARGLAAIRLDVPGIGDAPGDATALIDNAAHYEQRLIATERELLDRLEGAGVAGRFVAVGLCSSSYWGWQAAVHDERVRGAALINLYAFEWSPELVLERDRRRTVEVMRSGIIARLRRKGLPRAEIVRALRALLSAVRRRGEGGGSIEDAQRGAIADAFGLLARRGTQVVFLFSEREFLLEQLERQGQLAALATWPNLAVQRLPSRDHELRVLAVQEIVNSRIDRLLSDLSGTD